MVGEKSWDDRAWVVKSDNAWQRRLRRHQGWWRESHTSYGPGPRCDGGGGPVVSMLPDGVGFSPNLMTDAAVEAATTTIERLRTTSGPGLVQLCRLQRNLLSSQPLCFNLFGHLAAEPSCLLPWVRSLDHEAAAVTLVELETARTEKPLARSAFDAYVEYRREDETTGFLGIECKYAEDLNAALRGAAATKFRDATAADAWLSGAAEKLDRNGLRQFWYNTLLAQRVLETSDHVVGRSVVVALGADEKARSATKDVAAQLTDPLFLTFSSIEEVVGAVDGQDDWRQRFTTRYLDVSPSD